MMSVVSTQIRKNLIEEINKEQADRDRLADKYGRVWNTTELQEEFEVQGFLAPFVGVKQKGTGKRGSLMFQHAPRYYFNWKPDGE
jgi:hypothetical protein